MRVYADVLFLLNGVADYVLLLAAARLAGMRTRPRRLACGAAFGGLYAVAAAILPWMGSPPGLLLSAAAMIALVFAPRPWRPLLRALASLCGVGALAGGLALALARWSAGGIPAWDLAAALGGALVAAAAVADRRAGVRAPSLCQVEVELGGRCARCLALVDSGNRLRDPCGSGPVVVVDRAVLRPLLPAPLLLSLAAGPQALPEALAEVAASGEGADGATDWAHRICVVPYRAVGAGHGILCGLRSDAVRVVGAGEAVRQAVVAVSPQPLDPEGAFSALVPATLAAGAPAAPELRGLRRLKEGAAGHG
jgi:stage II sporulation protein GA (sporulation sigma-E factor processing peptidase)